MRAARIVVLLLAATVLGLGQPVCCVVASSCCEIRSEEARAPQGVDAPACPHCNREHPGGEEHPAGPGPSRDCACVAHHPHLTTADAHADHHPAAMPAGPAPDHRAPAPPVACAVAAPGADGAPPGTRALTLPLLL